MTLTTDRHEASRGLFATAELLVSFVYADKMLCGITLSRMKLRKRRNKTFGFCDSDASHPKTHVTRRDVTRRSVHICTGSDVTGTQTRATVAEDALKSCSVRVTSSIDEQLQSAEGMTVIS